MKGARRITQEEILDLNLGLLKRHPSVRLFNIININREYSINNTIWRFIKRDGHIACAISYDERDFYYNVYGDPNDVEQLLSETLDWDNAELGDFKGLAFHYLFACTEQPIINAIQTALGKLNKRPVTDATYELWILDDVNKASLAVNKHMTSNNSAELTPAHPLSEEDASIVHHYWTYSNVRSYDIVHEAITHRPSSCIKTTDQCRVVDTEPSYESRAVSWGIARCDYSIGMVHTKSAYRGRGLGKAVIADMSLKISQLRSEDTSAERKSAIVHSYIDPHNVVSKKLHADLGYKYNDEKSDRPKDAPLSSNGSQCPCG